MGSSLSAEEFRVKVYNNFNTFMMPLFYFLSYGAWFSLSNQDFFSCLYWISLYRCFQQLLNFLHPMTELFELAFFNILISLGSHYQHKLLMSRYVVWIRLFNFLSYFFPFVVKYTEIHAVNENIFHLLLIHMIRFTLMLQLGSLIHLLFWGNLLSSPC